MEVSTPSFWTIFFYITPSILVQIRDFFSKFQWISTAGESIVHVNNVSQFELTKPKRDTMGTKTSPRANRVADANYKLRSMKVSKLTAELQVLVGGCFGCSEERRLRNSNYIAKLRTPGYFRNKSVSCMFQKLFISFHKYFNVDFFVMPYEKII